MRRSGARPARGFSLVELMVALTIGLLLLAGVLQIVLSNRQSYRAQQATAQVQENLRLAKFVLSHSIAHAGFVPTPNATQIDANAPNLFPASDDPLPIPEGAVVSGQADTEGQNDAIRVRFLDRGGIKDCRGVDRGSADKTEMADFEFYVNSSQTLICRVVGGDSQPIAENVQRFEITYGLDTNGNGSTDLYTSTLTGDQAREIRSVRVQLLLSSGDGDQQLAQNVARTFRFADGTTETVDNRRVYMMMDDTIALPNVLP